MSRPSTVYLQNRIVVLNDEGHRILYTLAFHIRHLAVVRLEDLDLHNGNAFPKVVSQDLIDLRCLRDVGHMESVRGRCNVVEVLAPSNLVPMLVRVRVVLSEILTVFTPLFELVLLRDLDEQAPRLVHVNSVPVERTSIQIEFGLVSLEIVLELHESCVSLLEHNLDLENIPIKREQSEDHICGDPNWQVGDDQDSVRFLALLVPSLGLELVPIGVRRVVFDTHWVHRVDVQASLVWWHSIWHLF